MRGVPLLLIFLAGPIGVRAAESDGGELRALPRGPLFEPLLADPRWPRLAGMMVKYRKGGELGRVWLADFGSSLGLVEGPAGRGRWQAGIHAAVFTQWDMETLSNDQLSADYLVGVPVSWRRERLCVMARLFHISTHLGDEFVLTHPQIARVNLSYEAVDLKASWAATPAWRLYAGAGRMIRRDPDEVGPGSLQYGSEYRAARTLLRGRLRPVAALDMQQHQRSRWALGLSARAGLQLENRSDSSRRFLLMAELYKGRDPTGQFYQRSVEYAGLGLVAYY